MKTFAHILFLLILAASVVRADSMIVETQTKLKRQGFYDGTIDGKMGSQTSAAIRRYQLAQNLTITGELSSQTLRSLGLSAPPPVRMEVNPTTKLPPAHPTKPIPENVALADIFKGGPYISIGAEGQITTIRKAQKNLKLLGYYSGSITGKPSAALITGLKVWQQSAGFRQTGRFDENTLKGLSLMPD
ncbi:MAG: peptidoglycan-binding domain-containing protein [Verrucomicrobiota bacterium]